jgi:hypothetical protein
MSVGGEVPTSVPYLMSEKLWGRGENRVGLEPQGTKLAAAPFFVLSGQLQRAFYMTVGLSLGCPLYIFVCFCSFSVLPSSVN